MRKPVLYALVAAVVVLLATTVVYFQRYHQAATDYAQTKTEADEARTSYGNAINSIAEIQDSLSAISVGDSSLRMRPGFASEGGGARNQDKEALERIAVLKASVERTKTKIQQLEADLHRNGIKIAGLQKMVTGLKQSVTEKEQQIADLSTQVNTLQTQVTGLTADVSASRDTIATQVANIEQKRQELDTIYYVIGDKSQLRTDGILEAKGGLLGIGKTMKPTGAYPSAHFTALDIDQSQVVHIPAKKAQVLTAQPTSSYLLRLVGDAMELQITDPQAFRSVKHLVIVTS